jgi:hypothetical protein
MKRLISKRGANSNALTRRNPKSPANQGKASVAIRFSQKKTGKNAGLFVHLCQFDRIEAKGLNERW